MQEMQSALLSAFNRGSLEQMLLFRMDVNAQRSDGRRQFLHSRL